MSRQGRRKKMKKPRCVKRVFFVVCPVWERGALSAEGHRQGGSELPFRNHLFAFCLWQNLKSFLRVADNVLGVCTVPEFWGWSLQERGTPWKRLRSFAKRKTFWQCSGLRPRLLNFAQIAIKSFYPGPTFQIKLLVSVLDVELHTPRAV